MAIIGVKPNNLFYDIITFTYIVMNLLPVYWYVEYENNHEAYEERRRVSWLILFPESSSE